MENASASVQPLSVSAGPHGVAIYKFSVNLNTTSLRSCGNTSYSQMSRNNTLQNELLILGITIDEAMAAEIAMLNVEGKPIANFYYISFNLGLHRGRGQ